MYVAIGESVFTQLHYKLSGMQQPMLSSAGVAFGNQVIKSVGSAINNRCYHLAFVNHPAKHFPERGFLPVHQDACTVNFCSEPGSE